MTPEDITKNNQENNETPKASQENIEQKEISQEEFLNWLDNEGNNFRQETQQELSKSNSVDLDQSTFEKIKNETGIESDLNTLNQEAEKHIDEARKLIVESEALQKSPSYSSFEGIDLMDTGQDQREKLAGMVASGKISAEELEKMKNEISAENIQKQESLKHEKIESLANMSKVFEKYNLQTGQEIMIGGEKHQVIEANREKGFVHIGKLNERGGYSVESFYNPEDSERLGFDLDYKKEKTDPLSSAIENFQNKETEKIQSATSLPELYKILQQTGGVQGSSEFYSTGQIWERVRAYVNGEADENVITRTGGLREKVKELKKIREQNQQTETTKTNEQTLEAKNEYKNISYKEWRDTLPQVHWTAGYLTFRPGENTELKDLKYFVDKNGDHYVSYTETDGSKQARKLYITANNAGISQEIDPSILKA